MRIGTTAVVILSLGLLTSCSKPKEEAVYIEDVAPSAEVKTQKAGAPKEGSGTTSHSAEMREGSGTSSQIAGKTAMPHNHPPIEELPKGHPPVSDLPQGHPQSATPVEMPEYTWDLPEGWSDSRPPNSIMRVADLITKSDGIEKCAIYRLVTGAGIQPFIQMWRAELGLERLTDPAMKAFLKEQKRFKTKAGHDAVIIDLTTQSDTSNLAIVNILITMPQESLSIKLKGTKEAVANYRDELEEVAGSIKVVSHDNQQK